MLTRPLRRRTHDHLDRQPHEGQGHGRGAPDRDSRDQSPDRGGLRSLLEHGGHAPARGSERSPARQRPGRRHARRRGDLPVGRGGRGGRARLPLPEQPRHSLRLRVHVGRRAAGRGLVGNALPRGARAAGRSGDQPARDRPASRPGPGPRGLLLVRDVRRGAGRDLRDRRHQGLELPPAALLHRHTRHRRAGGTQRFPGTRLQGPDAALVRHQPGRRSAAVRSPGHGQDHARQSHRRRDRRDLFPYLSRRRAEQMGRRSRTESQKAVRRRRLRDARHHLHRRDRSAGSRAAR